MQCVVPESIHTPTTEGIGNSEGVWVGGGEYRGLGNSRVERGWTIKIAFHGVKLELSTKIATY